MAGSSLPFIAYAISWGLGWALAIGAVVIAMYVHLDGGAWNLTRAIAILGGTIGLGLGAYGAARFRAAGELEGPPGAHAVAWALAFLVSSFIALEPGGATTGRGLVALPLMGILGGFLSSAWSSDYRLSLSRRIVVMTFAWMVAVLAGALLALPATYAFALALSRVLAPVSEQLGAIVGGGLGGFLGGAAAAAVARGTEHLLRRSRFPV